MHHDDELSPRDERGAHIAMLFAILSLPDLEYEVARRSAGVFGGARLTPEQIARELDLNAEELAGVMVSAHSYARVAMEFVDIASGVIDIHGAFADYGEAVEDDDLNDYVELIQQTTRTLR